MTKIKNNELSHTGNSGASNIILGSSGEVTPSKLKIGSDAAGDIAYYNGTQYTRLAKGTNGHYLKQGASNAPEWAAVTTVDANTIAKAWIVVSTDRSPAVLRDSFNLDSFTDDGTGRGTITFDTDFANINYCIAASIAFNWDDEQFTPNGSGYPSVWHVSQREVGFFKFAISTENASGGLTDADDICVVVFGDQ